MRIPIASDGYQFIVPLLLVGLGLILWRPASSLLGLGCLSLLLALFCVFFFRDFNRHTKIDESLIYSPGDGRILEIESIKGGENKDSVLIRIFLSVLDGHVQRVPVAGQIESILYKKGTFLDARHPQAHLENEQNTVILRTKNGRIGVTQIAGLIARRIVCWVKEGQSMKQGERYGLIRFGSQVDIVIPAHTQVLVQKGDRVIGGKTVLAQWRL